MRGGGVSILRNLKKGDATVCALCTSWGGGGGSLMYFEIEKSGRYIVFEISIVKVARSVSQFFFYVLG